MAYERQTARKCRIGHILEGQFVQQEGWDPSYVTTSVGEISRCNIMAIVVARENDALIIDDGSGRISLRTFGQVRLDFDVGDKILVIGRPREYNSEMYIAAEVIRKIENDKWLEYRKAEISMLPRAEIKKVEKVEVETEQVQESSPLSEKILVRIRELDDGKGADIEEAIKNIDGAEKVINNLMEEGDIFEIKPGRVKVLE